MKNSSASGFILNALRHSEKERLNCLGSLATASYLEFLHDLGDLDTITPITKHQEIVWWLATDFPERRLSPALQEIMECFPHELLIILLLHDILSSAA